MILNVAKRQKLKLKDDLDKAFNSKVFKAEVYDRIIYQRWLGHLEITNGYRWHETTEDMCYLCHKWAYSLVLWDTRLASNENIFKSV